jgi:hypothetical protein
VAVGLAARVKGLSEAAFRAAFGTEEQCRAALEKLRWPQPHPHQGSPDLRT